MAARKRKAAKETVDPTAVVTTSQLAVWLEVDERTVRKLAARGVLEKVGHGRFRLRDAITAYIRHLRAALNVRTDDAPDLTEARARLAEAQRKVHELKAAEMAGRLVRREVVEDAFGRIAMALRQRLLTLPSTARGRIPHLTAADADELEMLVRDILRDVPEDAGLPPMVMEAAGADGDDGDDGDAGADEGGG